MWGGQASAASGKRSHVVGGGAGGGGNEWQEELEAFTIQGELPWTC